MKPGSKMGSIPNFEVFSVIPAKAGIQLRNMGSVPNFAFMLIFTMVFSIFIFNGWYGPKEALAKEAPFTLEDRDRLIRLEVTMKEFKESVDKRFDDMMTFMWILAGIFTTMTFGTISFAIWDRRTMIRPFETRLRDIEEGKIDKLINSLRELARTDTKVEEVLRKFNIL